jgi:hypothetical protein
VGPKLASTHDITFFCGGKEVSKSKKKNEATWDKSALYFQILKGKKLIGDSGYKGKPDKVSTTCSDHNAEVKEFLREQNRDKRHSIKGYKFSVCLMGASGMARGYATRWNCTRCALKQYVLQYSTTVSTKTLRNGLAGSLLLVSSTLLIPILVITGATNIEQDEWNAGSFATAGTEIGGRWLGNCIVCSAGVCLLAQFVSDMAAES